MLNKVTKPHYKGDFATDLAGGKTYSKNLQNEFTFPSHVPSEELLFGYS